MAIYRLEAKIISRRAKDRAGRPIPGRTVSVVAKAAYRSGQRLHDEQQERTYNYRSRAQEVVHAELVLPEGAPAWLQPDSDGTSARRELREELWNRIEQAERRSDSQLAREFVISLPLELEQEQQVGLIRGWCSEQITVHGFVADFAVHRSRDGQNPHAHVLCTLRPVEGDGFGRKPDQSGKFHGGGVGFAAKSELEAWRLSWETHCNAALEAAGSDARVDHRSLKDQGIDREPEPKIGADATAMERRGAVEDSERGRAARQVRMQNDMRSAIRDAQHQGEVAGETEVSWGARLRGAFTYVYQEAQELLRDESSGPRPEREPKEPAGPSAPAEPPGPIPGPEPERS
ncbi:MAG: MobA/MobL family protein [Rubrivivax sp.]|nr:MobA/MobL family protein [Rubrivivax sp.]